MCICCCCSVIKSCLTFVTLWAVACQAPLSMGFSRQEYWSGLPFPSPGDLTNLEVKHVSSASPELAGGFFTNEPLGKPTHAYMALEYSQACFAYLKAVVQWDLSCWWAEELSHIQECTDSAGHIMSSPIDMSGRVQAVLPITEVPEPGKVLSLAFYHYKHFCSTVHLQTA